ncbi:MAG: PSD1 and planctomycete cytochrome C domain-containing protein, partial [Verrucomicrobiota bacterium]
MLAEERAASEGLAFFEQKIRPVLEAKCYQCHSAKAEKLKGGLHLDSRAGMLRGGDSGKPAIIAGNPDHSPLIDAIRYANRDTQMPPKEKLPDAVITDFVDWVKRGAPDPRMEEPPPLAAQKLERHHWAFQTLRPQAVPTVKHRESVRTPVDAFLLAKLEEKNLLFSKEAERIALLRRAYLDLIGLPPTPEEAQAFLGDKRPDAFERLVDRLLESPHFGERWGRHWLDGAGYVDVMGIDNDAGTVKLGDGKWRYRDYVVQSFNEDKPLDRFLLEQLAGDELVDWRNAEVYADELKRLLIATGFLRTAPDDTDEMEINTPVDRHNQLQRTTELVMGNLLALTVHCAKCHDHKYEPVTQRDYYRLNAMFATGFNPVEWPQPAQRALPDVPRSVKAEIDRHNSEIDKPLNALKKQREDFLKPFEYQMQEARALRLPEAIRADVLVAVRTQYDKRNEIQKYLVERFGSDVRARPAEVVASLVEPAKGELAALDKQIEEMTAKRRTHGSIQAVYDVGEPPPIHVLYRGNLEAPGALIQPGFLAVLCDSEETSFLANHVSGSAELQPAGKTSGRRLALAQWLTRPDTPASSLVSRVFVNRAWQHLFGKGIVETSDNFGRSGAAPTHPELLDWLAQRFIDDGWRVKSLVRQLVTSSAYRQTAQQTRLMQRAAEADPDDTLLWRQRLRRVESEVVRDSLLAVSGQLDRTIGGPPVLLANNPDGSVTVKQEGQAPSAKVRRSLYLLMRRNYHPSFLAVFDQPIVAANCSYRPPSAVVSQSLTMLHDQFVLEQAEALAQRITEAAAGKSLQRKIELAFQLVLARPPTAREQTWSADVIERQNENYLADGVPAAWAGQKALAQFCHA